MALVTWELGRVAIVGPATAALTVTSGVVLLTSRINAAWLILGGALAGLLVGR
jgi:chromate transporter